MGAARLRALGSTLKRGTRQLWIDIPAFTATCLVLWELLYLRVGPSGISSPLDTFVEMGQLLGSARFLENVEATGVAFLLALAIAVGGGLAIGLFLGLVPLAGEVAAPILNALAALPKITLYPVILLIFGLGLPARVAFGTIHGIFPIVILTMNGIRTIRPVVRKTGRALRLTQAETIRTVLLPAALPEIFSGLRMGVGLCLFGTLIGELFASDRGIGFVLMRDMQNQDVAGITAIAVMLFAVAIAAGIVLLQVDRRLHGER
jgi:NitT/TauT family transport system permease protein